MSETLTQVLTYIDTLLPNSLTTATKVDLINAEQRKVWEHMTKENMYEFTTVTDQRTYTLPTDVTIDMVLENGLLIANSTGTITVDTVFVPYSLAGYDEDMTGTKFYDAFGTLGVYPIPDNGYPARLLYQEYPTMFASTDTTVQFSIDQDYVDVIKLKVMSRIAKSGRFPNVDLANNYEADAKEAERKMKVRLANKKSKTPGNRWSYKDWK